MEVLQSEMDIIYGRSHNHLDLGGLYLLQAPGS